MIVRNEERIITRCLSSIVDYIGCWVISDTGSTDCTISIIRNFFQEKEIPGILHCQNFVNFEQARNEALSCARESSLAFDYLLLIDADMELEVSDPAFADNLTADGYTALQRTDISYWNMRLVHRKAEACYRGVTHEYLDVKGDKQRLLGIHFIDHAEGSNRREKFQRDIALLQRDIEQNPENARSWFYLAQSLRDIRRWAEAAEAYERRIALGGWAEEAWYARLQLARCLLKQGDTGGFLQQALTAWSERPHRAEPLYDLAHYHRNHSEYQPAVLFAMAGLQLAPPTEDVLFIEDWVYAWALREEYAIVGYYVSAHRDRAAMVCNALALAQGIPPKTRDTARRNLSFYTRPLKEMLPSFDTERLKFEPPPGFSAMNPSVMQRDRQLWCVQRSVNYELTASGEYHTSNCEPVKTRNYLLRLDESYAVRQAAEILPPEDFLAPSYGRVQGFEDMRPFIWSGALWATTTVRDLNAEGWCETMLCRLDEGQDGTVRLANWRVLRPNLPRQHEKNWIIVASGEKLHFIHSVSPTRIVDHGGRILASRKTPWAADQIRGSSQAIRFRSGWLAVSHEHAAFGRSRSYMHRFVWFDRGGTLRHVSMPFVLVRPGVEFVAGLAWHPDGRRVVISFGVADAESWVGTFEPTEVAAILTNNADDQLSSPQS